MSSAALLASRGGASLPIIAQWTGVPARTPPHMPNPEHSAGDSEQACPLQSGLSSPALLRVQNGCLGRAALLQFKDHKLCFTEKNVSDYAPSTLS